MLRSILVLAVLAVSSVAGSPVEISKTQPPRQASFHIRNVFTIKAHRGARTVRLWFAVPQEDNYSVVRNLHVTGEYAVRFERDSADNRVGYVQIQNPALQQITLEEEFDLTRTEVRNTFGPSDTRPLTDQERAALSAYLLPTTYVVVNEEMKKLAASITGGETNPVVAARKLYDWTYKNVNYWVKDPDHLKASPVGSAEYCLRTKTGNCTDFHSLFASLRHLLRYSYAHGLWFSAEADSERHGGRRQLSLLDPVLCPKARLDSARCVAGQYLCRGDFA